MPTFRLGYNSFDKRLESFQKSIWHTDSKNSRLQDSDITQPKTAQNAIFAINAHTVVRTSTRVGLYIIKLSREKVVYPWENFNVSRGCLRLFLCFYYSAIYTHIFSYYRKKICTRSIYTLVLFCLNQCNKKYEQKTI